MKARHKIRAGIVASAILAWVAASYAQEPPVPDPHAEAVLSQGVTTNSAGAPCIQPGPLVRLQDYNGPFKKTIGLFTQPLERKSVQTPHPPHFVAGAILCTLDLRDKFALFVHEAYDPGTFVSAAFNAGISQAQDADPQFGQGMAGYSKRIAASYTDQATYRFFKDFAYTSLFREDPRYYRMGRGNSGRRLLHAMEHVVVAHRDNGSRMFNFSEWLGNASAVSLGNLYHPGNQRGFIPFAYNMGYSTAYDVGFDTLREFWPQIAHKLKLPFRADPAPDALDPDLVGE